MASINPALNGLLFRLSDLPKELRLMIYAQLPRKAKHVKLHLRNDHRSDSPCVILITRSVPTFILATCKLVHEEARTIVKNIIQEKVLDTPSSMISSCGVGLNVLDNILRLALVHETSEREARRSVALSDLHKDE